MGKTVFGDGNIVTKEGGGRVMAAWLNGVYSHRHDGLDQDGSAPIDYAVDTGAANTLTVAFTPSITAHIPGLPLWIKVAATNTGNVTVAVNGLPPVAVKKNVTDDIAAGDLTAGEIICVVYDGEEYQMLGELTKKQADGLYATKTQGDKADAAQSAAGIVIAQNEIYAYPIPSFSETFTPWNIDEYIPDGCRYVILLIEFFIRGPDTNNHPRIWMRPTGSSGGGQVVLSPWAAGSGDAVGTANQVWFPVTDTKSLDYKFESPPNSSAVGFFRIQGYVK